VVVSVTDFPLINEMLLLDDWKGPLAEKPLNEGGWKPSLCPPVSVNETCMELFSPMLVALVVAVSFCEYDNNG
jgi:hypothetical protein